MWGRPAILLGRLRLGGALELTGELRSGRCFCQDALHCASEGDSLRCRTPGRAGLFICLEGYTPNPLTPGGCLRHCLNRIGHGATSIHQLFVC
jgi:hypothetical protein